MEIVRTKHLRRDATERFGDLIQGIKEPLLILFSGGSALTISRHLPARVIPRGTVVSVLDERYTNDNDESNFSELLETNLKEGIDRKELYAIDPRPQKNESLEAAAERFDGMLRIWKAANPEGRVVVVQSIGSDGHTAGIFSSFDKQTATGHWVVGYNAEQSRCPERITVTPDFLVHQVDIAMVYIEGKEKQDVLSQVLEQEGSLDEVPARIIRGMRRVIIYTDILDKR